MFSGGGGVSAAGTYSVVNGVLGNINLTSGGSGYLSAPSVAPASLYGCTSTPSITALMGSGGSGNVNCTSGSLIFTGGGGSGAMGFYTAVGGVIFSVVLTSPGYGYTSAPSVTVSNPSCRFYSIISILNDPTVAGSTSIVGSSSQSRVLSLQSPLAGTPTATTGYIISPETAPSGLVMNVPSNDESSFVVDSSAVICDACKNRRTFYSGPQLDMRDFSGWNVVLSTSVAYVELPSTGLSVTGLSIVSGGVGYPPSTSGKLIFSSLTGSGAAGTYTVNSVGVISSVTLTNGGSGYALPPTVSILVPTSCANISVAALLTAVLSPGGIGCTQPSGVLAFSASSGINASGTYVASRGAIVGVFLTSGGMF